MEKKQKIKKKTNYLVVAIIIFISIWFLSFWGVIIIKNIDRGTNYQWENPTSYGTVRIEFVNDSTIKYTQFVVDNAVTKTYTYRYVENDLVLTNVNDSNDKIYARLTSTKFILFENVESNVTVLSTTLKETTLYLLNEILLYISIISGSLLIVSLLILFLIDYVKKTLKDYNKGEENV